MDEFNVIIPTKDLNKLEMEYIDWTRLPYNLRMRSNDKCIERYGCTNQDLYFKLKSELQYTKDAEDLDPNNIVRESAEEGWIFDNYDSRLIDISNNLQDMSPYIVIINPNDDQYTLNDKIKKFDGLNHKFKIYSNDYSMQIWGDTVPNIYHRAISHIQSISTYEPSNLVKESVLYNEIIIKEMNKELYDTNIALDIPTIVPYFTPDELYEMNINLSTSNIKYMRTINESENDEDILNCGWNPEVACTIENMEFANQRQKKWFIDNPITIVEDNEYLSDIDDVEISDSYVPLNLIFRNPIPTNINDVSNSKSFYDIIWLINNKGNWTNYIRLSGNSVINPDDNVEVVTYVVPRDLYLQIIKNISKYSQDFDNYNTLFKYISDGMDYIDRSKAKLIYAHTINNIFKLSGIEEVPDFTNKFYKIYKGKYSDMDTDKLDNIIKGILWKYGPKVEVDESKDLDLIDL